MISLADEMSLLRNLLPAGVAVSGGATHVVAASVYPEEQAAVAEALSCRRLEFCSGRMYARDAMRTLGIAAAPIPVGRDRGPVWPEGVVGTITHTRGFIAAAIARRSEFAALGIDAEPRDRSMPPTLDRLIRTPAERDVGCAQLGEEDLVRLVFSAKESVHKCVAPYSGIRLGFHDVEVDLDLPHGEFRVRLTGRDDPRLPDFQRLSGRFALTPRFVLTATTIAAHRWTPVHNGLARRAGAHVGEDRA